MWSGSDWKRGVRCLCWRRHPWRRDRPTAALLKIVKDAVISCSSSSFLWLQRRRRWLKYFENKNTYLAKCNQTCLTSPGFFSWNHQSLGSNSCHEPSCSGRERGREEGMEGRVRGSTRWMMDPNTSLAPEKKISFDYQGSDFTRPYTRYLHSLIMA